MACAGRFDEALDRAGRGRGRRPDRGNGLGRRRRPVRLGRRRLLGAAFARAPPDFPAHDDGQRVRGRASSLLGDFRCTCTASALGSARRNARRRRTPGSAACGDLRSCDRGIAAARVSSARPAGTHGRDEAQDRRRARERDDRQARLAPRLAAVGERGSRIVRSRSSKLCGRAADAERQGRRRVRGGAERAEDAEQVSGVHGGLGARSDDQIVAGRLGVAAHAARQPPGERGGTSRPPRRARRGAARASRRA